MWFLIVASAYYGAQPLLTEKTMAGCKGAAQWVHQSPLFPERPSVWCVPRAEWRSPGRGLTEDHKV